MALTKEARLRLALQVAEFDPELAELMRQSTHTDADDAVLTEHITYIEVKHDYHNPEVIVYKHHMH